MTDAVTVVHCHAEGEVGDVVIAGVAPPPGETVLEQSRWIASDGRLRNFLLQEPRGGVFRHANLLVPPVHPDADAAFIIMEPADTPPMSGSNAMCVATVLLERGLVPITGPRSTLTLEAPGGLVQVTADCSHGRVDRVTVLNLPSFATALGRTLRVPAIGELSVDIAFGGDSFVVVDAAAVGLRIEPGNARKLAELGMQIVAAANRDIGFAHPDIDGLNGISFCLFAGGIRSGNGLRVTQQAVAIRPGKIDRSPTGTGVSARLAILHRRGDATVGDRLRVHSIIGSVFDGQIVAELALGDRQAISPAISGRTFITGDSRYCRDPRDPWPDGYRLNDTWPDNDPPSSR